MNTQGGLMLNLGCGTRVHPAWQNFDLQPMAPGVRVLDVTRRLPFADGSAAAVYHSHVLEHLDRSVGERFMGECRRVLKPGGVLRVAVPDLEGICRRYLAAIDGMDAGRPGAADEHGWMLMELLDQMARTSSGGEMLRWWAASGVRAESLVRERMGREFGDFRDRFDAEVRAAGKRPAWADRGPAPASLEGEVLFRATGEIHRWMYDRVSLGSLMTNVGLRDVRVCGATESGIEGWAGYELDTDSAGVVRKPDSLFMEGRAAGRAD